MYICSAKRTVHYESVQVFKFSDEQLFNLIENGDKIAFTEAYNKYHRLLYSVSYRYLMDREKAEEAVQYVFVRLWEYRSDLNIGISLKNYLFTMTKNYVLNIIRNENSMTEKQYELAQRASEFADDFVEKFENRERMDIFTRHWTNCLNRNARFVC